MTITQSTAPAFDITVSRVVPADPDTVWSLLTDVTRSATSAPRTSSRAGSATIAGSARGSRAATSSSWLSWSTVCTVTASEPGRVFAFESSPPSRSLWTYTLEAVDGGTRVTESMVKADQQPAPIRLMQRMVGVTDRAAVIRDGMTATLDDLAAAVS